MRVADRIALLAPGGIVGIGAPGVIATPKKLAALYGVAESAVAACLPTAVRQSVMGGEMS